MILTVPNFLKIKTDRDTEFRFDEWQNETIFRVHHRKWRHYNNVPQMSQLYCNRKYKLYHYRNASSASEFAIDRRLSPSKPMIEPMIAVKGLFALELLRPSDGIANGAISS